MSLHRGLVYPVGHVEHRPTLAELQQKHEMAWAELLQLGGGSARSRGFLEAPQNCLVLIHKIAYFL